ncbi:MAG TPA: Hpt domain-containing protein [Candidatus Acidoferrales bacterium]|nr:Hpt domain-containing protein [Candidatus Acidoferrales bacterium]
MKREAEEAQRPRFTPDDASDSVFDVAQALERMEGDRELLEELVHLFTDEWPKSVAEIEAALKAAAATVLERLAHGLKGAAANVGAKRLSAAALDMERLASARNLKSIPGQWEIVKKEAATLLEEFERSFRKASR